MQDMEFDANDLGKIQIADEVIQVIAGLAANEVPGVSSMSGGFAGGLTESLTGRKNLSKGVKVQFGENEKSCTLDLSVVLEFGTNIPNVSVQIQERIKEAVESMTGLYVNAVHVHVVGVSFPEDREKQDFNVEPTATAPRTRV